jgi:hypothetical protein
MGARLAGGAVNTAKRRKLSMGITISALALLLVSAGLFLWAA